MGEVGTSERKRSRRRAPTRDYSTSARATNYRRLKHPFEPQSIYSEDAVANMHQTAFRILEELGLKILLPEAREIYRKAGAVVHEDTEMVHIGRDIVEAALASAPRSVRMRAADPTREQDFELGSMLFYPGAGCPHVTDRERGRRPGSEKDFEETTILQQAFDVMHGLGPSAEPQDVPVNIRHYVMTRAQVALSDKPMFAYSRGTAQVEDIFEMVRLANGLDQDGFETGSWITTIINTNSPRQIDRPMAQGLIDFARNKQLSIVTPFCLSGAMAPVTMAGALTLQHAEALAAITLTQLVRPGAPVSYGGFTSNVDLKSGSPAFGTPEHMQAALGSGQLARLLGLPWRGAAGAAANVSDAQGAQETLMSLWATVLAGATVTVHSAGWLEGGLTFGYEKYINDLEALQGLAELTTPPVQDEAAIGFDAIAEVQPGGHFFAAAHTMERYQTAFYEPLVADLSNFGTWTEAGARTSTERATDIWKATLRDFRPPPGAEERAARLDDFIARRKEAGGAVPEA
jgi:trimethylamine--corrinoid protein Co-methyltransferase